MIRDKNLISNLEKGDGKIETFSEIKIYRKNSSTAYMETFIKERSSGATKIISGLHLRIQSGRTGHLVCTTCLFFW